MKNRHVLTLPAAVAVACTGALSFATKASAQTINWANNTGNADALWITDSNWTGGVAPTSSNIANFGALTVTNAESASVGSGDTVNALGIIGLTRNPGQFTGFNYTISGTGTINLGTSGISFAQSQGITEGRRFTIAPNIALTGNQTWNLTNGGSQLVVTGVVSGASQITFQSADSGSTAIQQTLRLNNQNTFSGGFILNATNDTGAVNLGSNSTVTSGNLVSGPLGTGTVTLTRGRLRSSDGTDRTLQNSILVSGNVTLGGGNTNTDGNNTASTGGLIFSDAGLTTASTFTLGSATNGNLSVLRVGAASLTFDQVIAESGGIGQSVNFASISGTPTVNINRTKTATGNILSGGVNLVLANGAANPGALIGVNGSITATGFNKFSSGALISDNTAFIATDATNYSAVQGGKAAVYNNARVSFATDQTQATVAGLYTADSQVRLGLGSGSGIATVTENYDQSAIGNGLAGLVSASSGTITYNGTLTAGSDSTYRVGGGLGTLSLGTALTGNGSNLRVEGGGTVNSTLNNTYTGTTTVNSALTLSGASGALSATSGITVNNTSLTLDNTTANANRLSNSAGITLNRGTLAMNNSTTAIAESIGTLTIGSGFNTVSMGTAAGAANTKSITTGTLARNGGSVALFRGDSFGLPGGGGSALTRNLVIVSTAPTGANFVGGGGANGTTNISIIPWARTGVGTTATGGNFLTFDSSNNSLRPLVTATEVATNTDTALNNTDNVRHTVAATGTTTLLTADRTRNSFILSNTGATAATTGSLGGFTLNVTSGAVDLAHNVNQNFTLNNGTLNFGAAEGIITNSGGSGAATALNAVIAGSGGVSFFANNTNGLLQLGGTNTFTGGITVGSLGNAAVTVSNNGNFGNTANAVTHAGGDLRFFGNTASAREMVLLGNVGNNTLSNATSVTEVWTGDISGAGQLRLVSSGSTAATAFSLGGNNTYTGGTQIEGIAVTGSSNSALGTGTVTLIGANNNPAALTFTGAAPTLGGLRGTDGTVTINPTASAATLTVGSINSDTVFNGVIAQGASKTASVTKTGTGTLVLGGSNTYTGSTTVSAGVLNVSGSLAGGDVTVAVDSTLTGSGTIGGATTISANGLHNAGGIDAVGKQSFSSSLDYATNSIFEWDLAATPSTTGRGTNYDAVNASSLGSTTGAIFRVVLNGAQDFSTAFWDTTQQWTDIFKTGDAGSDLSFASIFTAPIQYYNGTGAVSGVPSAQGSFSITGSTLTWTAVPEPTTALAGLLIGAGLLRRRRA